MPSVVIADVTVPAEAIVAGATVLVAVFGWCVREMYRLSLAVSVLTERVAALSKDHDDHVHDLLVHGHRKDHS